MYRDYQKAKANQWKCEKCGIAFASFRELRTHKVEDHSY
jgi:ribosomal protein L37AE/L43A